MGLKICEKIAKKLNTSYSSIVRGRRKGVKPIPQMARNQGQRYQGAGGLGLKKLKLHK